jgi:hypothetical protein
MAAVQSAQPCALMWIHVTCMCLHELVMATVLLGQGCCWAQVLLGHGVLTVMCMPRVQRRSLTVTITGFT